MSTYIDEIAAAHLSQPCDTSWEGDLAGVGFVRREYRVSQIVSLAVEFRK
jgi:hypothetical protein